MVEIKGNENMEVMRWKNKKDDYAIVGLRTRHDSNFLICHKVVILAIAGSLGITLGVPELSTLREESLAVRDRFTGCDVLIQQIDLLERETLCFGNAEVGKDDTAGTCRAPDVKHLGAQVCVSGSRVDQVGRCKKITDKNRARTLTGKRETYWKRRWPSSKASWMPLSSTLPWHGSGGGISRQ
jgi:hypothetical protein